MTWIPAYLLKLPYNNFDHMTISKISMAQKSVMQQRLRISDDLISVVMGIHS